MAVNDSDAAWAIIFCAIFVAIYLQPASTVRVQEFKCEGEITTEQCKGKLTKVGRLKFIVNTHSGGVARVVLDGQDNWLGGGVYSGCVVVDSENWSCGGTGRGTEVVEMVDGQYSRRSDGYAGIGGYHISGLTGWRHWLSYLGFPMKPSWLGTQ